MDGILDMKGYLMETTGKGFNHLSAIIRNDNDKNGSSACIGWSNKSDLGNHLSSAFKEKYLEIK